MKKVFIILIVFSCMLLSQQQDILLPVTDSTKQILEYTGFTLQYNEEHEQADWVAYVLTKEEVLGKVKRKDAFRQDKEVTSGSATLKDYKASGYDRGHLAPAADLRWNKIAMRESFLMSNMSPQLPKFNRGIWKRLEAIVRTFAYNNESIYVVTGPVLTEDLPDMGGNDVSVPQFYYKVVLDLEGDETKGIAFLLPQTATGKDLTKYAVTIDSVETVTGLNFFHSLEDELEENHESEIDLNKWVFKPYKNKTKKKK